MSYFEQAHKFTAQWEGGISDHPNDRGGVTAYGVSIAFLQSIANDGEDSQRILTGMGVKLPIRRQSVLNLTQNQAAALFRWQFWNRLRCDDFPPRTAIILYDAAVNHGCSRSVKLAQKAYNACVTYGGKLAEDGALGPLTRNALIQCNTKKFHDACIDARRAFYEAIVRNNPSQEVFLHGWLNRADALEIYLQKLPEDM